MTTVYLSDQDWPHRDAVRAEIGDSVDIEPGDHTCVDGISEIAGCKLLSRVTHALDVAMGRVDRYPQEGA